MKLKENDVCIVISDKERCHNFKINTIIRICECLLGHFYKCENLSNKFPSIQSVPKCDLIKATKLTKVLYERKK